MTSSKQVSAAYHLNFCTFFFLWGKPLDIWCLRYCRPKNWAEQMEKINFTFPLNPLYWKKLLKQCRRPKKKQQYFIISAQQVYWVSSFLVSIFWFTRKMTLFHFLSLIFKPRARVEPGEITNNSKSGLSPKSRKRSKKINVVSCESFMILKPISSVKNLP